MLPALGRIEILEAGWDTGAPSIRLRIPLFASDTVEPSHQPLEGRAAVLRRRRMSVIRQAPRQAAPYQQTLHGHYARQI